MMRWNVRDFAKKSPIFLSFQHFSIKPLFANVLSVSCTVVRPSVTCHESNMFTKHFHQTRDTLPLSTIFSLWIIWQNCNFPHLRKHSYQTRSRKEFSHCKINRINDLAATLKDSISLHRRKNTHSPKQFPSPNWGVRRGVFSGVLH